MSSTTEVASALIMVHNVHKSVGQRVNHPEEITER
jgi:hypothetical protein